MLRRYLALFKKVVDEAMISTYRSGGINPIYEKLSFKPIPPKGLNLNVPMSDAFKKVVASPTDSGDPGENGGVSSTDTRTSVVSRHDVALVTHEVLGLLISGQPEVQLELGDLFSNLAGRVP